MNQGDVVNRERIAFLVLILLLALAAALGLELLLPGSTGAPPRLATPQPPAQNPVSPSAPGQQPSGDNHGGSPSRPGGANGHGSSSGGPSTGETPTKGGGSSGGATAPGEQGETQPPPSAEPTGVPFAISGSVRGLTPGATTVLVLRLSNPGSVPIEVTSVRVSVSSDSTPRGCSSTANLVLHQPVGITAADPVAVPARSSVTLSRYPRAPRIELRDLRTNQEACKGTMFGLSYTGSAHS